MAKPPSLYMVSDRDDERISPTDRHVVSVMDSAEGATEDEVLRSLRFLREERGLKPGTKNGPRHFSWFREHRFRIHLYRRDSGHLQRTLIIHRAPVRVHRYRRLDQ